LPSGLGRLNSFGWVPLANFGPHNAFYPSTRLVPLGRELSLELVLAEMRKRTFGILGTVSKDGRPHATGVAYGVSTPGDPLAIYILSDVGTKKARNIARNPNVSFVIPIPRMLLTMAPMSCIQFQGKARVLPADDSGAVKALSSTRIGRMMLKMARNVNETETGEKPVCFIMVIPDPVVHTYGVGVSLMQMRSHMGQARGKVELPASLVAPTT
jgi:nitroimidazol reductase NimA-like FMN-containing flavoprotein (pyridoxamine 5'-phosphate oxidase superfamily)